MLYAIFLIGVYRSNLINDWVRLFISVVVHPIIQELAVTYQRDTRTLTTLIIAGGGKSVKRSQIPLTSLHISSLIESYFIFLRRFMIGEGVKAGRRNGL